MPFSWHTTCIMPRTSQNTIGRLSRHSLLWCRLTLEYPVFGLFHQLVMNWHHRFYCVLISWNIVLEVNTCVCSLSNMSKRDTHLAAVLSYPSKLTFMAKSWVFLINSELGTSFGLPGRISSIWLYGHVYIQLSIIILVENECAECP